tara:strand:+ start:103 stop:3669 length:3567 start_codon:yes stop_codon:yes gene_type:complete
MTSDSKDTASSFAGHQPITGKADVVKAYLDLRNPYDYRNPSHLNNVTHAINEWGGKELVPLLERRSKNAFNDSVVREPEFNSRLRKWILSGDYGFFETNGVTGLLKMLGHDGYITTERQGTTYAAFSPNQIKSADPITRDDAGNVIPLSERFQSSSDDIRYMPAEKGSPADVLSVEFIPGRATGFLDKLFHAPLSVRYQFHNDMLDAHVNPATGKLHILEAMKVEHEFDVRPSAYRNSAGEMEYNPSMLIRLGRGTSRQQAEVAASLFGLYAHQEAVGGYLPGYKRGKRPNAFRLQLGRELTEKEIDTLHQRLESDQPGAAGDIAFFPTAEGADIIHLGFNSGVSYGKLGDSVESVFERSGSSYELGEFRAGETIYKENKTEGQAKAAEELWGRASELEQAGRVKEAAEIADRANSLGGWKENRNGEGYKENAKRSAGSVRGVRPDIFRRLDDRIGDPIKEVYQKWEDAGYGETPREGRRHGATELQPAVVKSKNGYDVPVLKVNNATHGGLPKPKDSSKWNEAQWRDYLSREQLADRVQSESPGLGVSQNEWGAQLQLRLDGITSTELPPYPARLAEWAENPKLLADHIREAYAKNPDLVLKSKEGLESVRQMHALARMGALPIEAVGLNYFWGFLSRMLGPYDQEAGWIRMVSNPKFMQALYDSIDGKFAMPRGVYWTPEKVAVKNKWTKNADPKKFKSLSKARQSKARAEADKLNRGQKGTWVELVYRVTRGQQKLAPESAGMNAVQNINGFHSMLSQWNGKWSEVHKILNTPEFTGPQMREAMWSRGLLNAGIHDKVNSFVILTLARDDVVILDRWQMINFWEPQLKAAVEAKDGVGSSIYTLKKGDIPVEKTGWSDTVQAQLSGMAGSHATYRVLENALGHIAKEADAYLPPELRGTFDSPSGAHWVTWNIAKNEPVGHSSLDVVNRFALDRGFPNTPSKRAEFIRRFNAAKKFTEKPGEGGGFIRFEVEKGRPVVSGPAAYFLPAEKVGNSTRHKNSLGYSMLETATGNWRVYDPEGALVGVAKDKGNARLLFERHMTRSTKKAGVDSVRFMPAEGKRSKIIEGYDGPNTMESASVDGYVKFVEAKQDLLAEIDLPYGWEVDWDKSNNHTKWGTAYYSLIDPDGDAHKIRIGDHPASPSREGELGSSEYRFELSKPATLRSWNEAVGYVEKWAKKKHGEWYN